MPPIISSIQALRPLLRKARGKGRVSTSNRMLKIETPKNQILKKLERIKIICLWLFKQFP
jgi:hypothetical protein